MLEKWSKHVISSSMKPVHHVGGSRGVFARKIHYDRIPLPLLMFDSTSANVADAMPARSGFQ